MRYFTHTAETLDAMLKATQKSSLDELFVSIPQQARLSSPLRLPPKLDERQLKRELVKFAAPLPYKSFLGAGATEHFVPEWVSQQLLRAEWYTSYTPYQPEASQGTLQAIFEFQSMVASLFGLDIANASMYDGATALVEALLMAIRVTSKKTVVLLKTIHPEYRQTVQTYLHLAGFRVVEIDFNQSGATDINQLGSLLDEIGSDLAAVAVQSPNFFGRIENLAGLAEKTRHHGALVVGAVADITSCGIISSMGELGADIAVGEGLGLLGGINLGGPGVGLFSCKSSLLRQLPGRLAGMTTDKHGRPGFVLTLSTREQHIRREKATSNICTNHNLMALALSMTLSAYGKTGFRNLALTNIKKTIYLRRHLHNHNISVAFKGPHYNESVINLGEQKLLEKRINIALKNNIIAGLPLGNFYPELAGHLLISTTELHDDADIKLLAEILAGGRDE